MSDRLKLNNRDLIVIACILQKAKMSGIKLHGKYNRRSLKLLIKRSQMIFECVG